MIARRAAILVLGLAAASPLEAQESVFNLPVLGVPGTGESTRARAMGGASLGLEGDPFSLEAPAQLARFTRAGFHLSAIGQRVEVDDGSRSGDTEDVTFPMGQVVVPGWKGTAFALGYYQFLDFDASVTSTVLFDGDTLPVSLRSEGAISVLAPAAAWAFDDRTAAGLALDVYVGSRRLIRQVETGAISPGALTTVDSVARDFRAVGLTASVEHRWRDLRLATSWRWRPSIESEITGAPGVGLVGRSTEFDVPSELALGAASRLSRWVEAAAALRWSDWSDVEDPAGSEYGSALEVGGGIELAPGRRRLWIFGPEAPLRAGLRWRRLPLRVGGEAVEEWAASAGYGRGFLRGWSRIDVVVEAGRRGDLDTVGVTERFVRLGVGLSAFEQWRRDAPPGS